MNLDEKRRKVIDFLRHYNHENDDYKKWVVLAAPARDKPNKIRVYMNGGDVGKIAINEDGVTIGINSKKYSNKYKGKVPEVVHILEEKSKSIEANRLDALINAEYLKYAEDATIAYSANSNAADKERTIETLIMDYRNQKCGNAAIDMEMQYSVEDLGWVKEKQKQSGHVYPINMKYKGCEWYNEEPFNDLTKAETKSPRVDLMVLNDYGIGFVELKVDNKSCKNLSSHIVHMNYIMSHQDVFIKDVDRRLSVLKEYELLEPEMNNNIEKWKDNPQIWCGILFVGKADKLDGAKQMIKKQSNVQNIRFCFVDTSVVMERRLNMSSEVFVSKETFISSSYHGEK